LRQYFLGGNAPVHDPNALGLAVLFFDALEKVAQRRFVAGVAGHDLVGQRKALRGHHQGNDDLDAIRALVTAVAKLTLVLFILWRIALKIGARQVVEQHLETGIEEVLPAFLQMAKERRFVGQQAIVALVEFVNLGQGKVFAQEVRHGAALEPMPVQPPFAARGNEPIATQRLENQIPARAFATGRQPRGKELIALEFFVEMAGQPASAPLPGPVQCHRRDPNAHRLHGAALRVHRHDRIILCRLAQEHRRLRPRSAFLEELNGALPAFLLKGVDLTQIEHVALHDPASANTLVSHDAPITVKLAVFLAGAGAQKHDGTGLCPDSSLWE
jgi:hypothetical protein